MFSDGKNINLEEFENVDEIKFLLRSDLENYRIEHQNIGRRIAQSQGEVDRLVRRNAASNTKIQQLESQQNVSLEDIKTAYDSALNTQQRLFVTRGQLEKFQNEQETIEEKINFSEMMIELLDAGLPSEQGAFTTVEMMIQAQEAERQRLSRQMHDGPAQALSNFILQAEIASRLFEVDPDKARDELRMLKNAASTTFQQVRDFIFQLRPMMLDDLGLIPTIKRYVETIKAKSGKDIEATVSGNERRLEPYIEVVVFRSIQELINNADSHSHGTEIRVQLDLSDNEVRVSVEDNGRGFDPEVVDSQKSMGLRLMKERAELMGGFFEVDTVPGQGSRISFRVPAAKVQENGG
jgi:two-component system sensor histidine kinase DegS